MNSKRTLKTKAITMACMLALAIAGTPRCFASTDPGAVTADVFLARPACLIATILGSAVFVIALPFAALSKSVHQTAHSLVVKPAQATFTRPLGDFTSMTADGESKD
jgi:hypothetical protein